MPMTEPDAKVSGLQSSDLALVVNSYNRRVLLERALTSVYEHLRPLPAEVIVIDDGSTDGSVEYLQEGVRSGRFPGLVLVRPPEKVTFAGGVNLGILESTSPYVCLFETDNVVSDAGIWRGVAYLKQRPSVAGVGFRVTTVDGRTAGNSMSFPSAWAFVLGQQLTQRFDLERPGSGPRRDIVFTSPLVLSRAAIARFGLMNVMDFPFCDCDLDWCRRINDAGFELHVIEDVSVVHDQGDHKSEFSRRRTLDFHRARLRYFELYDPAVVPFVRMGLLARHVGELALLKAGQVLGKVSSERVATRRELLRRWSRKYREL
jgi:GT2 family glycosyltransferase